ncbi:hypothetical protein C7S17_4240 [Burkholderia thailandensis]|nr:hypothetical protein [Burkholderia thailandensis]
MAAKQRHNALPHVPRLTDNPVRRLDVRDQAEIRLVLIQRALAGISRRDFPRRRLGFSAPAWHCRDTPTGQLLNF